MPSRVCGVCGVEFVPTHAAQKYCEEHKNRHAKHQVDRRRLGARERPGYYRPRVCEEPGCGAEYEPTSGRQRFCETHRAGAWERNNRERHLANRRAYMRRRRHAEIHGEAGVYDRLVEEHGEACRICGATPETTKYLCVDHDHETGAVRGLLCEPCNIGLGWFRDDPARLLAAIDYLRGVGQSV